MKTLMNVLYTSITGNTKHFLTVMQKEFKNVKLYQIDNQTDLKRISKPFFCFIPTYAKGTQEDPQLHEKQPGLNLGIHELDDTLTMNEELGWKKNYTHCLGVIGSGNKNFGKDLYCWTALKYHRKYHIPVIADYELRGTSADENHINQKMVQIWNQSVPKEQQVQASHHQMKNTRLAKLEYQYKHSANK